MEKINILLANKLHDAIITSLKYTNNILYIKINCEGMDLRKLLPDLENMNFTIECINVKNLSLDFEGMILIDELTICKDDKVTIKVLNGDLYLECNDFRIINIEETTKRNNKSIALENILKSNL